MNQKLNNLKCQKCNLTFKNIYLCKYEKSNIEIMLCVDCSKKELNINPHKVLKVIKSINNSEKLKYSINFKKIDPGGLDILDEEIKKLEFPKKVI